MTELERYIPGSLDLHAQDTEALVDLGARLVGLWAHIEESKTEVLRALARVIVELRSRFRQPGEPPDWAGRSWEYRQAAERLYEAAGVPPDSVANVQAALRYHVGNLLRETVPPKELEAAGLLPSSPRDRIRQARSEAAAALEALRRMGDTAGAAAREYPALDHAVVQLGSVIKALESVEAQIDAPEDISVEDLEALSLAIHEVRGRLEGTIAAIDQRLASTPPKPKKVTATRKR